MNNNLFIISGVTVSLLIVILLFKLNKTKIEYDNKLLVLNRKVRDLTNLVDLSNTKNSLLEGAVDPNMVSPQSIPNGGEQDTNNTQIENQYKEFVSTNETFFNNLENFEAPIPQEVKNDIDTLVNENDMYSNLDSFEFKDELEPEPEPEPELEPEPEPEGVDQFQQSDNTQTDELPQSSVDEEVVQTEFIEGVTMETVEEFSNEQFNNQTNFDGTLNLEELDEVNSEENVLQQEEVNSEENVLQQEEVNTEESNTVNFENLDSMSVKELQEICRENKLKIKGRKDELIDRIKEHFSLSKL